MSSSDPSEQEHPVDTAIKESIEKYEWSAGIDTIEFLITSKKMPKITSQRKNQYLKACVAYPPTFLYDYMQFDFKGTIWFFQKSKKLPNKANNREKKEIIQAIRNGLENELEEAIIEMNELMVRAVYHSYVKRKFIRAIQIRTTRTRTGYDTVLRRIQENCPRWNEVFEDYRNKLLGKEDSFAEFAHLFG